MARRVNFVVIVVLFLAAPATFAAKDCDIDMTSNATFAVKKQMCYDGSVQERTNSKWAWKAKYSSDLDDYIDGTVRLFGWASTIAMLQLDAAANK
jgi:hypothetical protein